MRDKLEKIERILFSGTREEIKSLQGEDLTYHISRPYLSYSIHYEEICSIGHGLTELPNCFYVFGYEHDFRTSAQKKCFSYEIYIKPWYCKVINTSIFSQDDKFILNCQCGYNKSLTNETFELNASDIDSLFNIVALEELLAYTNNFDNYRALLSVHLRLDKDGEKNYFQFKMLNANNKEREIYKSVISLLERTLPDGDCRNYLLSTKQYFDDYWNHCTDPETGERIQLSNQT